jgi:hypothetical protein
MWVGKRYKGYWDFWPFCVLGCISAMPVEGACVRGCRELEVCMVGTVG